MDVKGTLKAITLELRRELEGRYDAQGTWHPGDLERCLASIGVWRDRKPKPVDELPRLAPEDREARRVVDAFLESRREAGRSREDAIAEFVRDAAYTWANRLLALRCMEARGLIDEVILQKDAYGGRSLQHNRLAKKQPERCAGEDEGLFAALFDEFARRAEELPLIFDPRAPEVALRPSIAALKRCISLLSGTSIVRGQEAATDEVFTAADALGWAYQYWNTEEKDRVFEKVRTKKGSKIEGTEIVPATCIYTEPYMVKFLVQNSLGAIWMGVSLESRLAERWEYFVRGTDRTPISKKPVAEITFLDPACGSGHFLIEAFELFYAMYVEEGVLTKPAEICASIMERNLYGIDIDERAVQIAALALVMKAKEKADDFVPRRVNLVATNIRLPSGREHLEAFLQKHPEDAPLKPALLAIFEGLAHADELGSLLQIEEPVERELRHLRDQQLARERKAGAAELFAPRKDEDWSAWKHAAIERLREHFSTEAHETDLAAAFFGEAASKGLSLVDLLARRYDVVAANPPYMGSKNMGPIVRKYVDRHFAPGKRDLYAAFILRCAQLALATGRVAFVAQQSWLFLPSFADLRAPDKEKRAGAHGGFSGILNGLTIEAIAHLGRYAFSEIGNAVVAPLMCVLANVAPDRDHRLWACRLTAPRPSDQQARLLRDAIASRDSALVFRPIQRRFLAIPGTPICYWLREYLFDLLTARKFGEVASIAFVYPGLKTGADDRFLRFHWECPHDSTGWIPYSKGGAGCERWYGQTSLCVDWRRERTPFREYRDSRQPYGEFYRKDGFTFSSAAKSLGVRRLVAGSIFGSKGPGIFPQKGEWIVPLLCSRTSTYFVRAMTVGLDILVENVRSIPLPQVTAEGERRLIDFLRSCEALKRVIVDSEVTERTYLSPTQLAPKGLKALFEDRVGILESVAACLHLVEGASEREVTSTYGITGDDLTVVLEETGAPAGWFPLLAGYDSVPELSPGVTLPAEGLGPLMREERRALPADAIGDLKRRLRAAYEAGPGAKLDDEDDAAASGDDGTDELDDAEAAASGARIPIPTETFLEELSQNLEIHPISVYWLLRELREKDGVVSKPELGRFVEDSVSAMVLRLLGHQWPCEIEGQEPAPTWADKDGIIPLTEGTNEPALIGRVRARLAEDFGADRAGAVEREFQEITGKPLAVWLASDFFKRHISQFRRRPIAWQLASTAASNIKRRGRGAAQAAPAFACLVYYHRLDADLVPKLRTQYVGSLRTSIQTELGALEKMPKRSADQDTRRVELEGKLEELKAFDARLEQVLTLGFASPTLDAVAAKESLDKWCSRDGHAPAPNNQDAFLAQERRYGPDLNDGVRVNIAPLQRAGLLAADVLAAKDVERAIADRAEWRADERRWCREGKLPQPGWWPVAPKAIAVPALPDALPAMDTAQEAMLFVWALLHAAGGSLPRMDVARAFALRCRPILLRKLAPSDVQPKASGWADGVGERTVAAGLLARVLSDLASRDALRLTTDGASRSVVTVGPHTPAEAKVDAWFRFEARLVLRVLETLQPAQVQEVERSITGDDRKLLAAGAA